MKLKVKTVVLAMIAVLLSSSAMAQGTGAGNGGDSDRDQRIAQIKAELMHDLPGPDGNGAYSQQYLSWCSRISTILHRQKKVAIGQVYFNKLKDAEYTLIDALIAAHDSLRVNPTQGGPMTKTLIDRAVTYYSVIPKQTQTLTKIRFLEKAIEFIVNVSNNFDRTYYVPYYFNRCRGGCEFDFDLDVLLAKRIEIAKEQLDFLTGQFTEPCGKGSPFYYCPIGDSNAFLFIAEFSAKFIADDLISSQHGARHSCSIDQLSDLSMTLRSFNRNGDRSMFWDIPNAVDGTARTLNRIADQIQTYHNGSCY